MSALLTRLSANHKISSNCCNFLTNNSLKDTKCSCREVPSKISNASFRSEAAKKATSILWSNQSSPKTCDNTFIYISISINTSFSMNDAWSRESISWPCSCQLYARIWFYVFYANLHCFCVYGDVSCLDFGTWTVYSTLDPPELYHFYYFDPLQQTFVILQPRLLSLDLRVQFFRKLLSGFWFHMTFFLHNPLENRTQLCWRLISLEKLHEGHIVDGNTQKSLPN